MANFVCFPFSEPGAVKMGNTGFFFPAHTQNKQLAYRDKMLAESHTPPLTRYIASPARKPERTRFH